MAKEETIVDDFYKWLKQNQLPKRKNQDSDNDSTRQNYKTFINQVHSYIDKAYDAMSKKDKAKIDKAIKKLPFEKSKFVSLLTLFAKEGDILYTMTVYDKMFDLLRDVKKYKRTDDLSNSHSAFIYLKMFLSAYNYQRADISKIQKERTLFTINDLHKLDGMDSLLYKLTCDGFVIRQGHLSLRKKTMRIVLNLYVIDLIEKLMKYTLMMIILMLKLTVMGILMFVN